jgi:hypothetical protein
MALQTSNSRWYYLGTGSFVLLVVYLSSALLLLFLLQFIFPWLFAQAGSVLNQGIPRELGYGLLYLIGLPVLSLLLVITVVGIPVDIFGMVFYLFTILMAHIITSLVIATWYDYQYQRHWTKSGKVFVVLAVFIALKLSLLVPFASWLISLGLILLAFGAIINNLRRKAIPGSLARPL